MRRSANCHRKIIGALIAAGVAGCAPEAQRLSRTFSHPGPAAYQRAEAIVHDPYLLDDVGPEVVGARPREYQRPLNEVDRARLAATPPPGVRVLPPPGLPVAPPPVIGGAYPAAPVVPTYPAAPAPAPIVTTPYSGSPAIVVPPPYPTGLAQPNTPFQYQQRAPY